METSDGSGPDGVQAQDATKQAVEQEEPKKGPSLFNWSTIVVGGFSALAGILGTPYGIWIAAAIGVLGLFGFFAGRGMFKDWQFKNNEKRAGSKAGSEASDGSSRVNKNRDAIDDFIGRDRRS